MSMVVVVGQFDLHPEDVAAAAEFMGVMMTETAKEQGCLHYAFARDLTVSTRFQLSELWESQDALAAHFQTSHMANYRASMGTLRVESRIVRKYLVSHAGDL